MKRKQDSSTVDVDIAGLEIDLASARQLLCDANKPTPFRVELIGTILISAAIISVAVVLHHFFPDLKAQDLRLWGFLILATPSILIAFWVGIRHKRKANSALTGLWKPHAASKGTVQSRRST